MSSFSAPNRRSILCGLVLVAIALLAAPSLRAQTLDKSQQKCVTAMNRGGAKINKAQNNEIRRCLSQYQKGKESSAALCWAGDPRNKIANAANKLINTDQNKCSGSPPPYGYTSAFIVIDAGREQAQLYMVDLLGPNPDSAAALGISDPAIGRCQQEVVKRGQQLEEAVLKVGNAQKKKALKGDKQNPPVDSALALSDRLLSELLAAPPQMRKKEIKLEARTDSRCGDLDPSTLLSAFPGCAATDVLGLTLCATADARCRGCLKLNGMDGLSIDCDLLDDFSTNFSCDLNSPTPTFGPTGGFPTPTVGPTPTN